MDSDDKQEMSPDHKAMNDRICPSCHVALLYPKGSLIPNNSTPLVDFDIRFEKCVFCGFTRINENIKAR